MRLHRTAFKALMSGKEVGRATSGLVSSGGVGSGAGKRGTESKIEGRNGYKRRRNTKSEENLKFGVRTREKERNLQKGNR